jgi:hypothetical protein
MRHQINSLIPLIYEVVENPAKWYEVLEAVCRITGANKAILSLRDRMTAELVIPTGVEGNFSSPMLYNFDEAHVQSFVETYNQHDPWTTYEQRYHPNRPYALSSYLPHEELVKSKFWEWLNPQGIGDTVVAEIGMLPKQWVAFNLYFAHDDQVTRDRVLELMTELLPRLRKVWHAGEVVRQGVLADSRALSFLEIQRDAAALLRPDGTMEAANEKARRLGEGPITFSGMRMGYRSNEVRDQFNTAMSQLGDKPNQREFIEFLIDDYCLTLSLMGPAEDSLGMNKATRLLTISPQNDSTQFLKRPICENPLLTPAEKELVQHLAHGGKIKDFCEKTNLTKHGADNRWRSVKQKLNVEHPREIYAIHRVYCAANYDKS